MLWLNDTPGLTDILIGIILGVIFTVKATLLPSDVEADSLRASAPFHTNGESNPTPLLKATMIFLPDFHTLSGNPSEFISVRLYSSPLLEVTKLNPPAKLLEPILKDAPVENDWPLPPCMRSISQSIGLTATR